MNNEGRQMTSKVLSGPQNLIRAFHILPGRPSAIHNHHGRINICIRGSLIGLIAGTRWQNEHAAEKHRRRLSVLPRRSVSARASVCAERALSAGPSFQMSKGVQQRV
ncbi:hypothetical protein BDW22DRAFT_186622 [Trametopsis cervina]|nr:hypothetical protein BDW22DRAFT_186622 [Trametopsis cervina]